MSDEFSKFKFPVATRLLRGPSRPHVGPTFDDYKTKYAQTVGDQSDLWWAKVARETLYWDRPFVTVRSGSFEQGDVVWFPEGGLNASYNCVDRWAFTHPDKTAIIYEADEPGEGRTISYAELYREVNRVANVLRSFGVQKGDIVSIYLPMTWHAAAAFFACARIGAIHSVVFAGFSAEALRERIKDCKSRVVITTDEGKRGGRTIATKAIVDAALGGLDGLVEKVLVVKRTGADVHWEEGRDVWWHEAVEKVPSYCPNVVMSAEDPLFLLYTSGSTGKPKGVVHTTGGYLLCAALTLKYVFDVHPDDRFACMADIGWITGHTYIIYGPLANGITTTIFESTPIYPTPSRYWETVAKHKITHFYSAPTAIRLLRRLGAQHVAQYDLSSLRVLGSVGEPINPEAWLWYHEVVGQNLCAVVDTYWQTETGTIVVAPFPGAVETKPGSATVPFFGIEVAILNAETGREVNEPGVEGVLVIKKPWPSIARTVFGDHKRFMEIYMRPFPGYYFTGDSASRDEDGYVWIRGRVDDVVNVSGHRLSTSEIETALLLHSGVAESAVVGVADELTGQAVHAFVTLKPEFEYDGDEYALALELSLRVRKHIGSFAAPRRVYVVDNIPKTRSGKTMRRIMRKIIAGETDQLGDLSTLSDPSVVEQIKNKLGAERDFVTSP